MACFEGQVRYPMVLFWISNLFNLLSLWHYLGLLGFLSHAILPCFLSLYSVLFPAAGNSVGLSIPSATAEKKPDNLSYGVSVNLLVWHL